MCSAWLLSPAPSIYHAGTGGLRLLHSASLGWGCVATLRLVHSRQQRTRQGLSSAGRTCVLKERQGVRVRPSRRDRLIRPTADGAGPGVRRGGDEEWTSSNVREQPGVKVHMRCSGTARCCCLPAVRCAPLVRARPKRCLQDRRVFLLCMRLVPRGCAVRLTSARLARSQQRGASSCMLRPLS